jgi:predicted Kef-type K+ transport protein
MKALPSQLIANREIILLVKAIMAFRGVTETGDRKSSEVTVMASIFQLQEHLYGFMLYQHGYVIVAPWPGLHTFRLCTRSFS